MRSVGQVQLKEMPDRPHRVGSFRNHGVRGRYVPDWGGYRAGRASARAVRQAGRAESPVAEIGIIPNGMTPKKVGGQMPNSELSRLAFRRRLVAQCWILVVIAGIVAWLIAA